jgi:hypothetical protein
MPPGAHGGEQLRDAVDAIHGGGWGVDAWRKGLHRHVNELPQPESRILLHRARASEGHLFHEPLCQLVGFGAGRQIANSGAPAWTQSPVHLSTDTATSCSSAIAIRRSRSISWR